MRVLPSERLISGNDEGTPLPESHAELPPVIRRTEFVAFALAGLLLIAIVAVLYVAKAFFLPVVMAVVAGTMLSPAATFLERRHVPRALGAVLIVIAVTARGRLHCRTDSGARNGMELTPARSWVRS